MAYLLIALTGLLGGLVSGLFGVGGGILFVPLLVLFLQFDPHLAIGTSIAAIIPTAIMGTTVHMKAGMVNWKIAAMLAVFAILGAWVGSHFSLKIDASTLRRLYAVLLLFLAFKMFFSK